MCVCVCCQSYTDPETVFEHGAALERPGATNFSETKSSIERGLPHQIYRALVVGLQFHSELSKEGSVDKCTPLRYRHYGRGVPAGMWYP